MGIDYNQLALRIADAIPDLRGCLVVSEDGMILASYPSGAEDLVRPMWLKFATLGEAKRGYLQFYGSLWVFVRRDPVALFAITGTSVRPGLLLGTLEEMLPSAGQEHAEATVDKRVVLPEVVPASEERQEADAPPISHEEVDEFAEVDPIALAQEFSQLLESSVEEGDEAEDY